MQRLENNFCQDNHAKMSSFFYSHYFNKQLQKGSWNKYWRQVHFPSSARLSFLCGQSNTVSWNQLLSIYRVYRHACRHEAIWLFDERYIRAQRWSGKYLSIRIRNEIWNRHTYINRNQYEKSLASNERIIYLGFVLRMTKLKIDESEIRCPITNRRFMLQGNTNPAYRFVVFLSK